MYSDDQEDFAKTTASKVPKVASVPVEVSELEVAAIQAILESTGNRKLLEAAGTYIIIIIYIHVLYTKMHYFCIMVCNFLRSYAGAEIQS